ncbi:O-antigen translocase [Dokdonia sinensis]|uniref:O-antigen translocase n=1 Tax=Dokdonia sinensis TaxID=2479847 RepID=A0A3M0G8S2_9FLAO|nr:O-antigen translocase [Dokdonia sinensis]RMB57449.1 O-antigen translocase [Dokdonia sinensis]
MREEQKSYQNVMKATTLFGGVQVIHILITIARSKIIALLVGAEGMGIASLFLAPLRLLTTATNLGLDKSAVKEIAGHATDENELKVFRSISILKRLAWFTAIAGALLMLAFSPFLSQWSFDSGEYTISFIWLGLALIFNQLSASRLAILQGLRKLQFLAKSNLYGAISGLFVTIPLYYALGIDGILPAIILTSGFIFLFAIYFSRKAVENIATNNLSSKEAFSEGRGMMKLGVTLSISTLIGLLVAYLVQIYISHQGGESEVGFYSAGIVILNTYVGLIFNAMSTDYFPRLSAICDDGLAVVKTVFEQAFIAILLITPIVIFFVGFAPLLIELLYSGEFAPTVSLVRWGILGMLFKAVSWSMGYIIIAKGDSSLFMKTAVGFNSILLALNLIGYHFYGLEGIGMSLLAYFVLHFITVKWLTSYRYGFKMASGFYRAFFICILFCAGAFAVTYIEALYLRYSLGFFITALSCLYSYRLLDEKVGFKTLVTSILKKKKQ